MPGEESSVASICGDCGHENPPGSRFCGACGERIGVEKCPECGVAADPGQKFCTGCGTALIASPAAIAAANTPTAQPAGERKQVTVVFADVMGSMELAEETDPERWREIVDGLFQILAQAVERFGGTVDKFTGDGLMALFGAPIAQEDHADRGCQAAVAMLDSVIEFSEDLRRTTGTQIAVRVGVNSGEVVAGSIGEQGAAGYTAIGHTVGLAQRMESLAEPGTAFVTERTAALVSPGVALDDLGEFEVKGSSQPLGVYRLAGVHLTEQTSRLAAERAAMSPFVGRDQELDELVAVLERAVTGEGAVVGIVGEAGLGKSRLCHELLEIAEQRGIKICRAQCQAHTSNVPLFPARQLMRSYFGVAPEDSDADAREKIESGLIALDPAIIEDAVLVHEFLSISDPERPVPAMNPEAKRRRLFELTKHVLRSRTEPVVNVVEDLHWIDPASDVFMSAFVDAVPGTPTMLITNFRPEYNGEWSSRSHYRQIPLQPLGSGDVRDMLARALGDDPSLDGMVEMIHERTGGNPFFAEETIRELVETGALAGETGSLKLARQIGDLTVPATVQAVLAARIDRLSPTAKSTLGAASAIGSEFREDVLAAVTALDPGELDAVLSELTRGEFIDVSRMFPVTEYRFRHPLTREVAYKSQLSAARENTHQSIAVALEQMSGDQLDEQAAFIAEHYESAGNLIKAIEWFSRAASWTGYTDPHSSYDMWRRVKSLADRLPDGDDAEQHRAMARLMLVNLSWRVGADQNATAEDFAVADELFSKRGDNTSRAVLHAAYGNSVGNTHGNVSEYSRLVERGLELADDSTPKELIAVLLVTTVYPFYLSGRFEDSIANANRTIELCDGDPTFGGGALLASPLAFALGFRSMALATTGRIEEARASAAEGIALARDYDAETLCWNLGIKLVTALWGTDEWGPELRQVGLESAETARAHGDTFAQAVSEAWLGAVHVSDGDTQAAELHINRYLEMTGLHGVATNFEPYARRFLADVWALRGDFDAAIAEEQRGIEVANATGNISNLAGQLRNLARHHVRRSAPGDLARAEELLDLAERTAAEMNNQIQLAALPIDRALLCRAIGDDSRCAELLDQAEEAAAAMDARFLIGEIASIKQGSAVV